MTGWGVFISWVLAMSGGVAASRDRWDGVVASALFLAIVLCSELCDATKSKVTR